MLINWDYIYSYLGIRDFIYFVSDPAIQATVFPVKLVFIFFTIFFLCAIIWFYLNSTFIQYRYLQDATGFFSKEANTLKNLSRSWKKIKKRADSGSESEVKLAVIEADDFLLESLQDADYTGETFEELINDKSKKKLPGVEEILQAHQVRDAVVHDPDYKLDSQAAKRILSVYEDAIKSITVG